MKYNDLCWNPKFDLRLYQRVKPWAIRGSEPGELKPIGRLPCKQNISGKRGQPNVLVVRCECMAETRGRPSRRFFGYDPIGEYPSLQQASEAWLAHTQERARG